MFTEIDPCKEGRETCGENSLCIVEGDSFTCACTPGYRYIYDENNKPHCLDINECQVGFHNCDSNAQCINEPGKFSCRCNPGFEGDGLYCKNKQTCADIACAENAQCIYDQEAKCHCIPGYVGDGKICVADKQQSCDIINNCSPYAMCSINLKTNQYECNCLTGFIGNGYVCEFEFDVNPSYEFPEESEESEDPTTTTTESTSRPVPQSCLLGVCWCPEGYTKLIGTNYCVKKEMEESEQSKETEKEDEERKLFFLSHCFVVLFLSLIKLYSNLKNISEENHI